MSQPDEIRQALKEVLEISSVIEVCRFINDDKTLGRSMQWIGLQSMLNRYGQYRVRCSLEALLSERFQKAAADVQYFEITQGRQKSDVAV